ncbi:hypothetical protein Taro_016733 [Colocasia esculenta]|uniref:Uncharacterized protein n=1 Tax=Colocasia esculenta TaxID=4460 RepID=A0A843UR49_COLES|nr:hypothetical protein [Colocasia esculenta]
MTTCGVFLRRTGAPPCLAGGRTGAPPCLAGGRTGAPPCLAGGEPTPLPAWRGAEPLLSWPFPRGFLGVCRCVCPHFRRACAFHLFGPIRVVRDL